MASGVIPRTVSEKRQFWRQVIDGYAGSGLSVSDWCRKRKVSESAFYAWKRKLACEPTVPRQRFAQLVVSDAGVSGMRQMSGNASLRIRLGDARIEVPAGFDAATLRVVLATLLRVRSGSC